MVFSANPEDYTNRGTIITPLKDRLSSQILTHYPAGVDEAIAITRQEAALDRDGEPLEIPQLIWSLVEEVAFVARDSDLIDQTSGVSARLSISAMELLASNLERRALLHPGDRIVPRLCDLQMLLPAITGKVEMVYEGEQKGAEMVARQLVGQAIRNVFDRHYPEVGREVGSGGEDDVGPYAHIVTWFADGNGIELSDEQSNAEYETALASVPGLIDLAREIGVPEGGEAPLGAELILEGLHQHLKLAREDLDSTITYKERVKFQLLRPQGLPGGDGGEFN